MPVSCGPIQAENGRTWRCDSARDPRALRARQLHWLVRPDGQAVRGSGAGNAAGQPSRTRYGSVRPFPAWSDPGSGDSRESPFAREGGILRLSLRTRTVQLDPRREEVGPVSLTPWVSPAGAAGDRQVIPSLDFPSADMASSAW